MVIFKGHENLHLNMFFIFWSGGRKRAILPWGYNRQLWNISGTLKTQFPTVFLVSKNPINVNQPGITVLFLFDMVWASLVKSVSADPDPSIIKF